MLRTTVVCAALAAVVGVLMVATPQPVSAHSYMMERARLLQESVLEATSTVTEFAEMQGARAVQQAKDTLAAEVARREADHEIEEYAAEHLAELGIKTLAEAEQDSITSLIQIIETNEDQSEGGSDVESEAELETEEEEADTAEAEADAAEEAADEMEAAADAVNPDGGKKKRGILQRVRETLSGAAQSLKDRVTNAARVVKDVVESAADTVIGPDVPNLPPGPVPLKTWTTRSEASDKFLKKARRAYEWADMSDGFPWHIKRVPLKDYFTDIQIFGTSQFTSLIPRSLAAFGAEIGGKRYTKWSDYPKKNTIGANPNWHTDRNMGLQRQKGVNPRSFRRAPLTWDGFIHDVPNFKGTRQGVEHAIHNWTPAVSLDDAFSKGLMFYMDYKATDVTADEKVKKHLKKHPNQLIVGPIVLYYYSKMNTIENLVPVAIQTLQTFDADKVQGVFYGTAVEATGAQTDLYWAWRWAKMCVAQADFMYHEIGPHLAFTHLVMEIAIIAAHREIPPLHPVHALIVDHQRKTLPLNNGARKLLVPHVFSFLDSPLSITVPTLNQLWAQYNFMDQMPHNDLRIRGIDTTLLREYDYARDSMALWTAIREYTSAILKQTYENDAAVKADPYIQAFAQEAHKIPGFPERIETLDLLIDVVSALQFIPTVQHSAVNYLQEFWGGYIPMEPSSLHGHHPAKDEKVTEKFLLEAMPTKFTVQLHRETLKLLSQPTEEPITSEWGKYARKHERHLPGLGSGAPHAQLIAAVNANTKVITERCKAQADERKYQVLEGPRVANSILI